MVHPADTFGSSGSGSRWNKTADDFTHTNAEYERLRKSGTGRNSAPREQPSVQGPGRTGYDKQLFSNGTSQELFEYAGKLGIDTSAMLIDGEPDRQTLIKAISARDATTAR